MPTTITGNLKDLTGAASVAGLAVRFTLQGCQGHPPRVTGTGYLAPLVVTFKPNGAGLVAGTLFSTRDNAGTGNGEIEVGGSLTAVWYKLEVLVNGLAQAPLDVHAKQGATLDISNVVPITSTPVITAPTGDGTYARLDGGNLPFTGPILARNGSAGSPGIAFATSATTGFFQQAANVLGVVVAGVLRWLINAAGLLLGSGQAIGWSSNTDPSLAAGDIWLSRLGAGIIGVGTAAANALGTLRAAIIQVGGSDTGITRDSAGVIDIGNGTQGDISGAVKAASIALGGGAALTTTARTGTGNLVLATAPTITNSTQDIINQPAATAFVLKDNQGGTRLSIPSGGSAAATLNNTDVTGSSTLTSISFKTGVTQNSGLKHQRFGGLCTTATTQGASCTTAVTWTSAFADANYTVSCTPLTPSNTPGGVDVESKAGAGFTIRIFNLGVGSGATYATVDCIAIHD